MSIYNDIRVKSLNPKHDTSLRKQLPGGCLYRSDLMYSSTFFISAVGSNLATTFLKKRQESNLINICNCFINCMDTFWIFRCYAIHNPCYTKRALPTKAGNACNLLKNLARRCIERLYCLPYVFCQSTSIY